jgi:hypothetical protein
VVAILLGLVMLAGASVALLDAWLDRRLPKAVAARSAPAGVYGVVTLTGLLLGVPIVIPGYLGSENRLVGIALVVVGVATLATWGVRLTGRARIPPLVSVLGYGGLAAAVAIGLVGTWSEVAFALGIR